MAKNFKNSSLGDLKSFKNKTNLKKSGSVEKTKQQKWLSVEEARALSLQHLDTLFKKNNTD